MVLLPLVPSAHASARLADAPEAGRQGLCETVLQRDHHTCRFCGLPAGGWQDVFHLDDDHEHWTPTNLAASCPLCHGVQHIGTPNANSDMHVIWLPEVEQPVLNVLVRGIHGGVAVLDIQRDLVGTTMLRAAQRADPGGDRAEHVGAGARHHTRGKGGCIEFMLSVKNQ